VLAACQPKTAEITPVTEDKPSLRAASDMEKEGHDLYDMHCGRCHTLKTVTDYSQEKWGKILPNMAQKAKLDATQESKIQAYVNWQLGL
jgi:cytochrome c5